MTQRSFFKSLALLGAAAAGCPGVFIPKFEPVRWKRETHVVSFIEVNPDWVNAEFVMDYLTPMVKTISEWPVPHYAEGHDLFKWAPRYNRSPNDNYVLVAPYRVRTEVRLGPRPQLTQCQLESLRREMELWRG